MDMPRNRWDGEIEDRPVDLSVTTRLNQPENNGKEVDRYLKSTEQPVELRSGSVIDICTGVDENQVAGLKRF